MFRKALFALAFVLTLYSCKKDDAGEPQTSSLLIDGPMSAKLGKKLNLDQFGNVKFRGNQWGPNSDELFVSAATQLLRLQLSTGKVEVLESSGGLFIGKTQENSAVIFIGSINGFYGYHTYTFRNESIDRILPLPQNHSTMLHIAGNSMFFFTGTLGPPSNPCTTPWDIWCSNSPVIVASSFYHVDKNTRQYTLLPGKSFITFSKDGMRTLLKDKKDQPSFYIFDNQAKTFMDSASATVEGTVYYDEVIKVAEVQGSLLDEVIIRNAFTGQELHRFTSMSKLIHDGIKWSDDGTRLYYMGSTGLNSSTMLLNTYDLASKQESTIAEFSLLQGGGIPASFDDVILSSDNKKVLIRYLNDLYIKDL